jgi:hypothetical protein
MRTDPDAHDDLIGKHPDYGPELQLLDPRFGGFASSRT